MNSFSILCPFCGQRFLSTDTSLIGQEINCPACAKQFCAKAEPATRPEPTSLADEFSSISCPFCGQQLSTSSSNLGKCFDCPACGRRFSTKAPPGKNPPSLAQKAIVITAAILISTGIVWVLSEVFGLEGTKANKGLAILGMSIAWGIWDALTGKNTNKA